MVVAPAVVVRPVRGLAAAHRQGVELLRGERPDERVLADPTALVRAVVAAAPAAVAASSLRCDVSSDVVRRTAIRTVGGGGSHAQGSGVRSSSTGAQSSIG